MSTQPAGGPISVVSASTGVAAPAPPEPRSSAERHTRVEPEGPGLAESRRAAREPEPSRVAAATDPTGNGSLAMPSLLMDQQTLVLDAREILVSIAVMLVWLVLMTVGITVGSQPYIDAVRSLEVLSISEGLGALLVILCCHTVPNIAMLCCLSAFLGVIASRAIGQPGLLVRTPHERLSTYVAAVTRGFFVFLVIQSGSILLSDQTFTNLTLERYIRLAGLSSLFSFAIGYNPKLFNELLTRVDRSVGGLEDEGHVPRA